MIDSGDSETTVNRALEQPAAPAEGDAGSSRRERLRRILFWAIGIGVVVAILATVKWWGDQQQRATLRGRSWPPEPVKVFFGRQPTQLLRLVAHPTRMGAAWSIEWTTSGPVAAPDGWLILASEQQSPGIAAREGLGVEVME